MFPERSVICPMLIGRDVALDTARTVLDFSRAGSARVVLVAGEAGIGKSRMLRELVAEARQRGFVVLQGASFEADRTVPYAPLLDLVRVYAATNSAGAAAHVLAPAAAELVRAFPELISVFADLPPLDVLDPEQERRRLFHAVTDTLIRIGKTQPVLLAIEDVHWADESSLELFLHLARRLSTQPVTLALSFRSDEIGSTLERTLADLDRTRIVTQLDLHRFTRDELATMLSAIFDGTPLDTEFVKNLHALTEGNPFFVEEVLKALVGAGELTRRANGSWHARPLTSVQAPRTAVEAVRRRLSGLSVPARDVASVAAVAGRRFDFTLLQELTGHDELTLLALIRELMSAQLVTEESSDRFAFRHALTREAILGELLARERTALHRSVADLLEQKGGAEETYIESLAYHAYNARDWTRAYDTARRASAHALSLHAPREAIGHLDRALDAARNADILPDPSLHLARGRALETLGDLQGAHAEFCNALELARRDARDTFAWEALYALGMLWAARDYSLAGGYRRAALDLARNIGDALLIARSLNRVANWHVNLEQPAPALRGHEEALALFERLDNARGVAETVDLLGMTHYIAGDLVQSANYLERAVVLHDANGDRRGLAGALALLCLCDGSVHSSCTAFGRATTTADVVDFDRPIRLTRDIGWRAGQAFVLYLLGDALAWRGAYDRAASLIDESIAIAEEMEHLQWQCGALRARGMLLLDVQDAQAARTPLEQAHEIALRLGSPTWQRWSASPLAIALARLGHRDAADAILDAAEIPSPIGREALLPGDEDAPTLGQRYLMLARAEVALASNDPSRALSIAEARIAAECGRIPRFELVRAQALLALDKYEAADAAFDEVCTHAVKHEALPLLWRAQAAHGQLRRAQRRRADAREKFDAARATARILAARIADADMRATFEHAVSVLAPPAPSPTARQKDKASSGGLTSRERDVARLVAAGKPNRAIARALGIGERTVEGYVAGALARLGFSTRAQLAAWTVKQGMDAATVSR